MTNETNTDKMYLISASYQGTLRDSVYCPSLEMAKRIKNNLNFAGWDAFVYAPAKDKNSAREMVQWDKRQ